MTLSTHDFFPKSFIGFDRLFDDLNKLDRTPNYPPHQVIEITDPDDENSARRFRIDMAVAGFTAEDIEITEQEQVIYVKGAKPRKQIELQEKTVFSNFSQRDFHLKFKIANNVVLSSVELKDGMLSIHLKEVVETPNVTKHSIKTL